jgi:hypothetical protein
MNQSYLNFYRISDNWATIILLSLYYLFLPVTYVMTLCHWSLSFLKKSPINHCQCGNYFRQFRRAVNSLRMWAVFFNFSRGKRYPWSYENSKTMNEQRGVVIKLREWNVEAFKCVENKIPKFAKESDWAHNFIINLTWKTPEKALTRQLKTNWDFTLFLVARDQN